jgi:oligoendopeptidase F
MIDAFQHWIYLHPGHSRAERQAHWLELLGRFGGIESWEGYDTYAGMLWQRQLHLFEVPFYYVEYGIAQLGALGVWKRSQQDWSGAVERYKRALALGNSRPLPELFEAAGVPFDFSPDYVARIIQGLRADLMPDG